MQAIQEVQAAPALLVSLALSAKCELGAGCQLRRRGASGAPGANPRAASAPGPFPPSARGTAPLPRAFGGIAAQTPTLGAPPRAGLPGFEGIVLKTLRLEVVLTVLCWPREGMRPR